jgi:DUF971 family protein
MTTPWPLELRIRRADRVLDVDFDTDETYAIKVDLLRAMTPSAAERGHGGGSDGPLGIDFSGVGLTGAVLVGAYAVRLLFDDGHDSGLYTWTALYRIGRDQVQLSEDYLRLLQPARSA